MLRFVRVIRHNPTEPLIHKPKAAVRTNCDGYMRRRTHHLVTTINALGNLNAHSKWRMRMNGNQLSSLRIRLNCICVTKRTQSAMRILRTPYVMVFSLASYRRQEFAVNDHMQHLAHLIQLAIDRIADIDRPFISASYYHYYCVDGWSNCGDTWNDQLNPSHTNKHNITRSRDKKRRSIFIAIHTFTLTSTSQQRNCPRVSASTTKGDYSLSISSVHSIHFVMQFVG